MVKESHINRHFSNSFGTSLKLNHSNLNQNNTSWQDIVEKLEIGVKADSEEIYKEFVDRDSELGFYLLMDKYFLAGEYKKIKETIIEIINKDHLSTYYPCYEFLKDKGIYRELCSYVYKSYWRRYHKYSESGFN